MDLHLRLRSQWLRPHPNTSARRLRPWGTLPCKLRVFVYTLCIRYYCPATGTAPPTPPTPAFRPLRGIAWTPSAVWSPRPRLQLAFGRRGRISKIRLPSLSGVLSFEKETALFVQHWGPRARLFAWALHFLLLAPNPLSAPPYEVRQKPRNFEINSAGHFSS